jgi:plastocyanin
MSLRSLRLVLATASLAAMLAGALTVGALSVAAGNPCFHSYNIPAASDASASEIRANPCDFAPTVTRVAPGTTVTFVNDSPFSHLITGANGAWGSRELELQPGSAVSYEFDEPGVYPFACSLHPGMSGAIVVGEAAGAAVPEAARPGSATTGVVAAGVGVMGLLLGGAGLWFATRRRRE